MLKEVIVATAQVVETRFAVGRVTETVLGTFTVAGKEIGACFALTRQTIVLGPAELLLAFAIHHLHERLRVDVPQLVLGEDEVVAGIYVTVKLHYTSMPAGLGQGTDAGLFANPVGQCGVEQLYVILAYVVAHPFIEDGAQKVSPLLGRDGEIGQASFVTFVHGSQVASVGMCLDALYNRGKLDVMAVQLLEEVVEVQRIVGIEVIDNCHGIPLHIMLLQQIDTLHHFDKRGLPLLVLAVFVVKLLRAVDGYAYQPVVVVQETAPLVGKEGTVGLYAVVDGTSAGILSLQLYSLLVKERGRISVSPPCQVKSTWGMVCDSIYSLMNFSSNSSLITCFGLSW